MFLEIFNDLLFENNLNRRKFAEQSGIPYTTVVGWTNLNRLPDYNALIKIADFFDCSIDYLTGRQDESGSFRIFDEVTPAEQKLINNFRRLSPENKDLVISITKNLNK